MVITYPPIHAVFGVSPHGILAVVGVAVGALLLIREVRRRALDSAAIERALTWAIPIGVVGARVDYVISHPHEFFSLGQMLAIWQGGLALFGGLIGGLLAGLIVARKAGFQLARLLDVAAPSFAVAIAIGRVGDLMLLDHLGRPVSSDFALAYRVQQGSLLAPGFGPSPAISPPQGHSCVEMGQFYAGCAYHLSAAYDLLGSLLLFALLLGLRRWVGYRAGSAFSVWAIWYGGQRLALDFTRGVDERPVAGLTGTQLIAIGVIGLGLASVAAIAIRGRGWGEQSDALPSPKASLKRMQSAPKRQPRD